MMSLYSWCKEAAKIDSGGRSTLTIGDGKVAASVTYLVYDGLVSFG